MHWTIKKELFIRPYDDLKEKTFYYQKSFDSEYPLVAKTPCNCKNHFFTMGQDENFEIIEGKLSVLQRAPGLSSFLLKCGAHFWISAGETVWAQDSKCGN